MSPFHFSPPSRTHSDERAIVLPADLASKTELFAFLRQAIPLPEYFGNNWDALEECLGDLGWLGNEKIALIHQDIPLKNKPADQKTYLQILMEAAGKSNRLSVVFPEQDRAFIVRLFSS